MNNQAESQTTPEMSSLTLTTQDTPFTSQETITANVILENLKKREDNFLDLKNDFRELLQRFKNDVDTIREIPNKSNGILKDAFKAHSPMLAEAIKEAFKREVEDIVTPLSSAVDNFETTLDEVSTKVDSAFSETTEELKKNLSQLVDQAKTAINGMVTEATKTLHQSIENTQNGLHAVEATLRNALAETEIAKQQVGSNQWKWMATVFVSSIATALLAVWVRLHV